MSEAKTTPRSLGEGPMTLPPAPGPHSNGDAPKPAIDDATGKPLTLIPAWGIVPAPVRSVLQLLQERAAEAVAAMDTVKIGGDGARDHDASFIEMSAASEAADRATRDYRSLFNAYTHKFHQPRPPIGELAAAQGAITQSFAKRYTPKTVAAIEALLSSDPNLDALRVGIRALGFEDFRGVSEPLDHAMAIAEASPRFQPWSASMEKAQRLSEALRSTNDDL